jgi:uncharacterized protein YbgA (DUF1722 family)
MKFLKEFSNWNPSLNKEVIDFIEKNKVYLMTNLYDKQKSDEENEQDLIDYFTEYPELMKSQFNIKNVKTISNQSNVKNMAPVLMNIGGVKDFRSF